MKHLTGLRTCGNLFYVQLGPRPKLSHPLSVKTFEKAPTPNESGFTEPADERRTSMAKINAILRLHEAHPPPIEIEEEPVRENFEVGHCPSRANAVLCPKTSPGEIGKRTKLLDWHSLAQFFCEHPKDRHLRVSRTTVVEISRCSGVHDFSPDRGRPLKVKKTLDEGIS